MILVKREYIRAIKHFFFFFAQVSASLVEVTANHKEHMLPRRILVLL